ncbi:hypothetical protein STTU_3814 [Streptomyces sp. Tu6071]|nr:hypothetical protein STTU_3814 [Streptomyces sp. Tu6071]
MRNGLSGRGARHGTTGSAAEASRAPGGGPRPPHERPPLQLALVPLRQLVLRRDRVPQPRSLLLRARRLAARAVARVALVRRAGVAAGAAAVLRGLVGPGRVVVVGRGGGVPGAGEGGLELVLLRQFVDRQLTEPLDEVVALACRVAQVRRRLAEVLAGADVADRTDHGVTAVVGVGEQLVEADGLVLDRVGGGRGLRALLAALRTVAVLLPGGRGRRDRRGLRLVVAPATPDERADAEAERHDADAAYRDEQPLVAVAAPAPARRLLVPVAVAVRAVALAAVALAVRGGRRRLPGGTRLLRVAVGGRRRRLRRDRRHLRRRALVVGTEEAVELGGRLGGGLLVRGRGGGLRGLPRELRTAAGHGRDVLRGLRVGARAARKGRLGLPVVRIALARRLGRQGPGPRHGRDVLRGLVVGAAGRERLDELRGLRVAALRAVRGLEGRRVAVAAGGRGGVRVAVAAGVRGGLRVPVRVVAGLRSPGCAVGGRPRGAGVRGTFALGGIRLPAMTALRHRNSYEWGTLGIVGSRYPVSPCPGHARTPPRPSPQVRVDAVRERRPNGECRAGGAAPSTRRRRPSTAQRRSSTVRRRPSTRSRVPGNSPALTTS